MCPINALEKGTPVTRLGLATKICRLFYDYVNARAGETSVNPALAIAPGKIQFDRLVLVGLHPVQGSNWQADIACDF
jgi:DNA-binding XRE family transcriptional regulator